MSVFFKVGLDICKANTNTSTAKYQYSFSKAERFPGTKLKTKEQIEKEKEKEERRKQEEQERIKQKKYVKHDYYLLPSTLSNRKTSFGFGNRTDFTGSSKKNKSQTSGSQEIKPLTKEEKLKRMNQFAEYEFERKYYHGPKYSIPEAGKGKKKEDKKDENKDDKEAKEEENKKDLVGPGRYNITKSFGSEAPKYSIKGIPDQKIEEMKKEVKRKIEEYEEKERQNKKPVPPHEEQVTIQIRKNGKYAISQIPNVNSFKIEKPDKYKNEIYKKLGKIKEEDEDKEKEKETVKFVDPLLAKQIDQKAVKKSLDSLMGVNFPSKFQTREPITFGLRHNMKSSMDNLPGPGSYIIPSEFGIYLTKGYNDPDKYPQQNVYVEPKKEQDPRPWRHGMKIIKPKEEEEDYGDQENVQEEEQKEEPKQEEVTPTPIEEKKEEKKEEEKKEEEKKEEEKKEEKKEEDKESECIMLRDILQYQS